MNLYQIIFFLSLFIVTGILITRVYNVMKLGEMYDWMVSVMIFVVSTIIYYVTMIAFLRSLSDTILLDLFQLLNLFYKITSFLFTVELIIYVYNTAKSKMEDSGLFRQRFESGAKR